MAKSRRKATPKKATAKKAAKKTARRSSPRRSSQARREPARGSASQASSAPRPGPGEHIWVLSVPYEARRAASYWGARWDAELRAHVYVGDSLPGQLEEFLPAPYSWEAWRAEGLTGQRIAASPPTQPIRPREHQEEAADLVARSHAAGRPGVVIADDLGLGKTFSALFGLASLPLHQSSKVLVVAPKAVLPAWRASIPAVDPQGQRRWCLVNYESLKKLLATPKSAAHAKRQRTKNKRIAAEGTPLVDFDVVVFDESHRLRNPAAQTSQAARRIARQSFKLWVSATCGENPLELSYLAELLAARTGWQVSDLDEWAEWCAADGLAVNRGDFGKWTWNPDGDPRVRQRDLERVRSLLFDGSLPAGVRRRASELRDWPEISRVLLPVELDREQRRRYEQAWTEFRSELDLAARGKDPRNALTARLRWRQQASLIRVGNTVELVEELLAGGRQVAVSCMWLESLDAIRERLAGRGVTAAVLHGQQSETEREAERRAFQRGETQIVLFTVTEGVNLHAGETLSQASSTPRAQVAHDLRWTAKAQSQVEGRTHRDGNDAPCYLPVADGTVEEQVARALLGRLQAMGAMHGDDVDDVAALERVLDEAVGVRAPSAADRMAA